MAGKRILLAEDDVLNREVLVQQLSSLGIKVDAVENGVDAMEKFAKSPENYYSALLMDVRMPVMDGLSAARNIRLMKRSDAEDVPIIALTAHAAGQDAEKSFAVGMNAHLVKPVDAQELANILKNMVK